MHRPAYPVCIACASPEPRSEQKHVGPNLASSYFLEVADSQHTNANAALLQENSDILNSAEELSLLDHNLLASAMLACTT